MCFTTGAEYRRQLIFSKTLQIFLIIFNYGKSLKIIGDGRNENVVFFFSVRITYTFRRYNLYSVSHTRNRNKQIMFPTRCSERCASLLGRNAHHVRPVLYNVDVLFEHDTLYVRTVPAVDYIVRTRGLRITGSPFNNIFRLTVLGSSVVVFFKIVLINRSQL